MRDPYRRRSERMTPGDIIGKLFTEKGVTAERVTKAQGLAIRSKVEWAAVLNAMTADQRQQVESV